MYDLRGMNAASPIGFLAAVGMLRVLTADRGLEPRLSWCDGHAVLDGIDPNIAVTELAANMIGRDASPEFTWTDSLRNVTPEKYRQGCIDMAKDQRALSFMAGWATDGILRNGGVWVTRLDMTSGRQKLLQDLRGLASRITQVHLSIALLGGTYEEQASFGLDPIAVRYHAHEHKAPTKSSPPGKPGLVWLAFESIPLHPVLPYSPKMARTTGWRIRPKTAYVWPTWDSPLTLEEVAMLRALPVERLITRPGVTQVWVSNYGSTGKYGMLYPPWRER